MEESEIPSINCWQRFVFQSDRSFQFLSCVSQQAEPPVSEGKSRLAPLLWPAGPGNQDSSSFPLAQRSLCHVVQRETGFLLFNQGYYCAQGRRPQGLPFAVLKHRGCLR